MGDFAVSRKQSRTPECIVMQEAEVARLFAQEIPEVASGVVEIKSIARMPKHRTKVALVSHDPEVDCVAACVGIRGYRIKSVYRPIGWRTNRRIAMA